MDATTIRLCLPTGYVEVAFVAALRAASLIKGIQALQTATRLRPFYDINATILHLLGYDHTRLTFRNGGIDRRLTDVHGHVIEGLIA